MSEWEPKKEDLGHPDSSIRLASAVHRFRVSAVNTSRNISFARSFKTTGTYEKTRKVMLKADDAREKLVEAVSAKKVSHERVVADARRYQPFIHQILLSCKVQPEVARLDERLIFEWQSGVEEKPKYFRSEAIMFDLVMCIVSEGLGKAGVATEASAVGEFAAASREYAAAAGIFGFLAEDHLPKWISRGSNVAEDELPVECSVGACKAFKTLFMANGQQMAIATVLIKPGTPNYSLLAKLCLGVAEALEEFVSTMREDAFGPMARMDKDFFTLVTFQIHLQQSLSQYFHSRFLYEQKKKYGIGIAFLSEAAVCLRTRESAASKGIPDVTKTPSLVGLNKDINDLRNHMSKLLKSWEKDNSSVYFEKVPLKVPEEEKLQEGLRMNKFEPFKISQVEPLLLSLPEKLLERSDSDIARELQEKLNTGDD